MPRKRRSKHEDPIHIDATPEEVAKSLFNGPPKPKHQWRFLRNVTSGKKGSSKHEEPDQ